MRDILKFGALGFGGYLLYTWFQGRAAKTAAPSTTATSTTTPATTAGVTSTAPSTTLALMRARAVAEPATWKSAMSPDQWNWLYGQVRNVPTPDLPGVLPRLITLDEYAAKVLQPLGLGSLGAGYIIEEPARWPACASEEAAA